MVNTLLKQGIWVTLDYDVTYPIGFLKADTMNMKTL